MKYVQGGNYSEKIIWGRLNGEISRDGAIVQNGTIKGYLFEGSYLQVNNLGVIV